MEYNFMKSFMNVVYESFMNLFLYIKFMNKLMLIIFNLYLYYLVFVYSFKSAYILICRRYFSIAIQIGLLVQDFLFQIKG